MDSLRKEGAYEGSAPIMGVENVLNAFNRYVVAAKDLMKPNLSMKDAGFGKGHSKKSRGARLQGCSRTIAWPSGSTSTRLSRSINNIKDIGTKTGKRRG